jgi:hypothetical protein
MDIRPFDWTKPVRIKEEKPRYVKAVLSLRKR